MYYGENFLLLDILKVLQKHTDEDHRLTQKEIIEILEKDYGYTNLQEKRKTVKNNLEKLIRYSKREDVNEILYTERERKRQNKDTGEVEISTVYTDFGYVHDFSQAELRLIIDSLLFSRHIASNKRKEIIEKLENLTSKHFNSRKKYIVSPHNKQLNNQQLFNNIAILDEAISNDVKVSFNYSRYVLDKKLNVVLEPQKNKDGSLKEYIINPYQMVATNGRYYLICNNDKYDNVSHYRVDRITNIKLLETKRKSIKKVKELKDGLSLPKHMAEHVYMFGGESISVSVRFKKPLVNEFIDWFGVEDIFFSNQTEDEVTATVKVNRNAMLIWALQYALHFKVISPQSLVDEIKRTIEKAKDNYL